MSSLPHHYRTSAEAGPSGSVRLSSGGLPTLESAPPAEFGGPGDRWSPEHLLVAAVADCFVLSFRAISRASNLDWRRLECGVVGVLDRVDGVTRFTAFEMTARLTIADKQLMDKAERLLDKAERSCLITNSLSARIELEPFVSVEGGS